MQAGALAIKEQAELAALSDDRHPQHRLRWGEAGRS